MAAAAAAQRVGSHSGVSPLRKEGEASGGLKPAIQDLIEDIGSLKTRRV
jgi:hypothetical protein